MLSEQSNTVNDGGRSKPSVWECSEVIFRDAENCLQADISHPKTSLHSEVETIRSRWSQIKKSYRRTMFERVGFTEQVCTKEVITMPFYY